LFSFVFISYGNETSVPHLSNALFPITHCSDVENKMLQYPLSNLHQRELDI